MHMVKDLSVHEIDHVLIILKNLVIWITNDHRDSRCVKKCS